MSGEELALAKDIGNQMDSKILCPRRCVEGQYLCTYGDDPQELFCPHCELDVRIEVTYE